MNERAQQRKLEKYEKQDRELRDNAIRACLASADGRALLWWLFGITKLESTPFTADPQATAFQCGEQNIGIQLKAALVETDPQGYVNLLQEKASEREQRERDLSLRDGNTEHDPLYGDGGNYDYGDED